MTQKTYQTFPYVPLEISRSKQFYEQSSATHFIRRTEKDYMETLEKIYQFDDKPFTDDFDLMTVQNIGMNISADYHDCLELVNSYKGKLFKVWDLSYIPTFIIHDIWNGKIYTYARPDIKIIFRYEQDKKRFPVHAECLKVWNDKSISEYGKLKWLFNNSDHIGYNIPNPDVTGHWKDISRMMKSLDSFPYRKVSLIIDDFNTFVNDLQYKPNPNRKYRLDYSLNYFGGFGIERME